MTKKQTPENPNWKPYKGKVLISCSIEDKSTHLLDAPNGKKVAIYIAKDFSWDGKVSKMTQGLLYNDYSIAKKGDMVLFHHNSCINENKTDIEGLKPHHSVYAVDDEMVFFAAYEDKRGIVPLGRHALAERIKLKEKKSLIQKPFEAASSSTLIKILKVPLMSDITYRNNQNVFILKYSDYEVNFIYKGKDTTVIRVDDNNIIAVENER